MAPSANPRMRIGQLAERTDVNPKTIRYYESVDLLPKPVRSANGYRLYSADDAARLQFIRRAKALGLSLEQIRDILTVRESGMLPCECVQQLAEDRVTELDQQIAELERMRTELAGLASTASEAAANRETSERGICPAIEARTPVVPS